MTIGRNEVLHAARLAEIAVDEAELETLVAQMARIVAYVQQLAEVTDDAEAAGFLAGPAEVRLREDEVRPAALLHPVSEMAPEFAQGLFLVPRRGVMEEE